MGTLLEHVLAPPSPSRPNITVIWGLGGMGKSFLVNELCQRSDVRRHFSDGVIPVAHDENRPASDDKLARMQTLEECIQGHTQPYNDDPVRAFNRLQQLLHPKDVLIVLDDVRNAETVQWLDVGGPRCHLVVTARVRLHEEGRFNANEIHLGVFEEPDALRFLETESHSSESQLLEVARCVGFHPLALNLAAHYIRENSASKWLATYREHVSRLTIAPTRSNPSDNIGAFLDVSTDALDDEQSLLYHSLGVFPEHNWIRRDLVLRFWHTWDKRFEDHQLDKLLQALANLALIEGDDSHISVHDLLHDWNTKQLGDDLPEHHRRLLRMFNPREEDWHLLKYDAYIFKHLSYHIIKADQQQKFPRILQSAASHLPNCGSRAHRDVVENLIVNVWRAWWNQGGIHAERAESFLKKMWPSKRFPWPRTETQEREIIGVRCAAEAGSINGVVAALCDGREHVRAAALRHMYYVSHQPIRQGVDAGIAQAMSILRGLADRVVVRGVPQRSALRSMFSAALLVALDQGQRSQEGRRTYGSILSIVRKTIDGITEESVLRFLGARGRALMAQLGSALLRTRFNEARAASPNNLQGLQAYFERSEESRNRTRQALCFLDRTYGSISDFGDVAISLLFESGIMTADRVSTMLVEGMIQARGALDPSGVKPIIQRIYDSDDGSCLATFCATHLWYSVTCRLPMDQIGSETLDTMRDFVTGWLDSGKRGYGIARHMERDYQIYPLAYYAALWNKANPQEDVDLLEAYAERAEQQDDAELKLHIAGSFSDFRQIMYHYPAALRPLRRYLRDVRPESAMWSRLVESLGTVWSLDPIAVSELLGECGVPDEFEEAVEAYSFHKPSAQLFMRSYHILTDILAYAPVEVIGELIETLDKALAEPSLGRALGTLANEVITACVEMDERYGEALI